MGESNGIRLILIRVINSYSDMLRVTRGSELQTSERQQTECPDFHLPKHDAWNMKVIPGPSVRRGVDNRKIRRPVGLLRPRGSPVSGGVEGGRRFSLPPFSFVL